MASFEVAGSDCQSSRFSHRLHFPFDANIWDDNTPNSVVKGEFIEISGSVKDDYNKIIKFEEWAGDSIYTPASSRKKNEATKTKSYYYFLF